MTRFKTHLIAVRKFNNKEEMIMRDIRDAMEYLAIMMSHHEPANTGRSNTRRRSKPRTQIHQSPATHIYCYDAKVIPFPHSHN